MFSSLRKGRGGEEGTEISGGDVHYSVDTDTQLSAHTLTHVQVRQRPCPKQLEYSPIETLVGLMSFQYGKFKQKSL